MATLDQDPDEFDIDVLENEFFDQFMSPDDQLLSDNDDDDDAVAVPEHSSLDAVRRVFEDRLTEDQMEELAEDLDLTSTTWMNIEEFRAVNNGEPIDEFDDDDEDD
jgi:hypothetical protein